MYYLQSRYYDPSIKRFISADSVIADVGGDIQGNNLYSYCFNNPINMSDPSGHWPQGLHLNYFHNLVRDKVAAGKYLTEVYVINITRKGFLDIYDPISNSFWEVKPDNAYGRLTGPRQIRRYESSTIVDEDVIFRGSPERGPAIYAGTINDGVFLITYHSPSPGLILYKWDPLESLVTREVLSSVIASAVAGTIVGYSAGLAYRGGCTGAETLMQLR
ncbi:MAG: RHS repeat-associated core domain-containing protein [Erysipelothrix sp.]|nr:RHS repeat-associated core domain-containing protein [Erysipelothrix sp.]